MAKYTMKMGLLASASALLLSMNAIAETDAEDDGLQFDTVVVTGVAGGTTKLDTSVSVSTLNFDDALKTAPRSLGELYRTIPGIRSEPATGEGNGSISVRGIPLATGGYKYVQLQEDGLPVLQFGDIVAGNVPNYVRGDFTLNRIESVRGGSASTLTSYAPGGIINHLSKTGEDGNADPFFDGIRHAELWLWDSWCAKIGERLHLYTLALSRTDVQGNPILPHQRNAYAFHVRHFTSDDDGESWQDRGAHLQPSTIDGSYYEQSVWSGSVLELSDGNVLMGFTGIKRQSAQHNFFQSMGIAKLNQQGELLHVDSEPFSCPERDYDIIRDAGYYLGPKEYLGADSGENNGPIMAWRDPFLIEETPEKLHAFWSAKVGAREGCVAHGVLKKDGDRYRLAELLPPILMPEGEIYTQTEVPKLYSNADSSAFQMLISSCDRLYEGQPDTEVQKRMRLYEASSLRGPWRAFHETGSQMADHDLLFGASLIDSDFNARSVRVLAPVAETASPDYQLTIAPVQRFSLTEKTKLTV